MIDWSQIKQVEEDVGAEDLAEVVEIFIEEVEEAVDALRGMSEMADAQMAPAMHFLKGSAYNLGFKGFGDYCAEGEKRATAGEGAGFDLQKVVALYEQSKAEFVSDAHKNSSLKF